MRSNVKFGIGLVIAWLLYAASCPAAEAITDAANNAAPPVDFAREIQPVLARRCYACHGPGTNEGGLRLHKPAAALAELESGLHAIVPGKVESSALAARIASADPDERMPPTGKPLQPKEIELFKRWISEGANWPEHWSFQPLAAQAPPTVQKNDWVQTPIDAFILHKLEAAGLTPSPPAEKLAWIRRATYNTTGLPPSAAEIADFLNDNSPQAYEKVIDRLLASPHYGEQWARRWLDLVRYADTNSFERDGVKPNAWRYRDYIIRAFNDDKPYDQFVREQLAGDELPNTGADGIIATGYYRLGLYDDEPADPEQARFDELDDIVSNSSQVFLGLTVNCARCHDHKIDPITQKDYYQMVSFFHELQPYGKRGAEDNYNQIPLPGAERENMENLWKDNLARLQAEVHALELIALQKLPNPDPNASEAEKLKLLSREKMQELLAEPDHAEYKKLKKEHAELQKKGPDGPHALSIKTLPKPPKTNVMLRGSPHSPGDEVQPGYLRILGGGVAQITPPAQAKSSGRRTALANWIARPENFLTARVIANRVWQHHFGRGIVRSANNFGQLGVPPTHPELLDYLADELIRNKWSLKALQKQIMLSSVYRQSSAAQLTALAKDPGNDLFWRYDMRRLSGEEIRDTAFVLTGEFNPKMYGPGIYATISKDVLAGQSVPGSGWGKTPPEEQARRSVYIHVKRSLIVPLLAAFDFPETDSSCEGRFVTTQPGQALALLNGEFFHDRATALARLVAKAKPSSRPAQVTRALQIALQHAPDAEDVARGVKLIEKLEQAHKLSSADAFKYYCLIVLNRNELIYLD